MEFDFNVALNQNRRKHSINFCPIEPFYAWMGRIMNDEAWLKVDTALGEQHKFCHVGNEGNIEVSIFSFTANAYRREVVIIFMFI